MLELKQLDDSRINIGIRDIIQLMSVKL